MPDKAPWHWETYASPLPRLQPPPFEPPALGNDAGAGNGGFYSQKHVELMKSYSWSDRAGANELECTCGTKWVCLPTRGPPHAGGVIEVAVHAGGHYAGPELMRLPFRCQLCNT